MQKISIALCLGFLLFSVQTVWATADHSKFPELKRNFQKPEDVTATCLKCHNTAGMELMKTSHWKWSRKTKNMPGKKNKSIEVGKINVVNNFCVAIAGNEPRCTSCHIGYGWKNSKFDFTNQNKIDCLVCHETTGTYKKFPTGAGYPAAKDTVFKGNKKLYKRPDYMKVAQSVGRPLRTNCGACHFYGGGGNAVKHGALDKSLAKPSKEIDIHMGKEGGNMICVDCHVANKHDIKGQLYSVSVENRDRVSCVRCHGKRPHTSKVFYEDYKDRVIEKYKVKYMERDMPDNTFIHQVLDKHYDKIACQTCHISHFSTKYKTKMWWDWSKAGDKKRKVEKDKDGALKYHFKKGEFKTGKNLVPEYYWFTGVVDHKLIDDKIDPKQAPIELNSISGECGQEGSKIWPFKVMRGKQLYDPVHKNMIIPKLFGKPGSGAYWGDWDWNKASEAGMKAASSYAGKELPYSGKYDWIETKMYWPITHLVTPKEKALKCDDCHSRNGRLAGLTACWIPGRDKSTVLDFFGMLLIIGSFIGVGVHGFLRFKSNKNGEEA